MRFFLTDGYADVIATAPLGKIPVLESAAQEWTTLSPVFENYSPATLGHIASGFDTMQRWLFRPGYTNRERAVIGEIEGDLLIPQVIYNIVVEKSDDAGKRGRVAARAGGGPCRESCRPIIRNSLLKMRVIDSHLQKAVLDVRPTI